MTRYQTIDTKTGLIITESHFHPHWTRRSLSTRRNTKRRPVHHLDGDIVFVALMVLGTVLAWGLWSYALS